MYAYIYINITYIRMLISMYNSKWSKLTNDIHISKHIYLMMRMSFVSYRAAFKIYSECREVLARTRYTLIVKQSHIFETSL